MLWAHALAEMGGGYVPCPPAPIEADSALRKKLDLPCHDILTVGAITTDAEVANRLSRHATVEHMEVYSVARAAQLAGVPFTAVLGIANHVGPNAHEEWIAHHLHAEAAARDAARVLLDP
jgi:nucleoside phosphorylase